LARLQIARTLDKSEAWGTDGSGAGLLSNGLGLCDGGELKAQMLNSTPMPNISTNVELSTEAPLLQNPC
jgi:hypothetical protein